jgi:hypothetical protein
MRSENAELKNSMNQTYGDCLWQIQSMNEIHGDPTDWDPLPG